MAKETSTQAMGGWYMPKGAKIAHEDGKEDNEGRKRNQTQNANIEASANANIQMEVAEIDQGGEDKVGDHNDDNKGNNDNTRCGKLRGKNVRKKQNANTQEEWKPITKHETIHTEVM